jgi:hypothetical protein
MNILDSPATTEKREAAFEIKFVIPAEVAERVLSWARRSLVPDPHADGTTGDLYRVNSLYFDTKDLHTYQRKGSYSKSKYRIRRYGADTGLFLERKLKSRGLVSKRRTRIPAGDLWKVSCANPERGWVGNWFRRRLEVRRLLPRCQIRYERVARLGMAAEGPIRLTVDRDVRAFMSSDCGVAEEGAWVPLLPGRCILELKFREVMPVLFKQLLEEVSLKPQPVSKYRLSIQAFGLDPEARDVQSVEGNGHFSAEALAVNHHSLPLEVPAVLREG